MRFESKRNKKVPQLIHLLGAHYHAMLVGNWSGLLSAMNAIFTLTNAEHIYSANKLLTKKTCLDWWKSHSKHEKAFVFLLSPLKTKTQFLSRVLADEVINKHRCIA